MSKKQTTWAEKESQRLRDLRASRTEEFIRFLNRTDQVRYLQRFKSFLTDGPAKGLSVRVCPCGSDSYTNGQYIVLGVPDLFFDERFGAVQWSLVFKGLLAHEIQHVNSSRFDLIDQVRQEYAGIMVPNGVPEQLAWRIGQNVLNILEDSRIEHIICTNLPGMRGSLKMINTEIRRFCFIEKRSRSKGIIFTDFMNNLLSFAKAGQEAPNVEVYAGSRFEQEFRNIQPMVRDVRLARTALEGKQLCMDILVQTAEYFAELLKTNQAKTQAANYSAPALLDGTEYVSSDEREFNGKDSQDKSEDQKDNAGGCTATRSSASDDSEDSNDAENPDGSGASAGTPAGDDSAEDTSQSKSDEPGEDDSPESEESSDKADGSPENGDPDDSPEGSEESQDQEDPMQQAPQAPQAPQTPQTPQTPQASEESEESEESEKPETDFWGNPIDPSGSEEDSDPNADGGADENSPDGDLPQELEDALKRGMPSRQKPAEMPITQKDLHYIQNIYDGEITLHAEFPTLGKDPLPPELQREAARMTRSLERIMRLKRDDNRFVRSGSLDPHALHRAGMGDSSIFMRKGVPNKPDIAIELLIDNSGSMWFSGPRNDDIPSWMPKSVIDYYPGAGIYQVSKGTLARAAAAVMEQSLGKFSALNITLFESEDDISAEHLILKRFDQQYKCSRCFNAIKVTDRGGANKDGFSIRVATRELLHRTEKRKFLVVLSDGLPSLYHTEQEAFDDVRAAVREARRTGVMVIPIMFGDEDFQQSNISQFNYMYGSALACAPQDILTEFTRLFTTLVRRS